jgi:hypothetical protein
MTPEPEGTEKEKTSHSLVFIQFTQRYEKTFLLARLQKKLL